MDCRQPAGAAVGPGARRRWRRLQHSATCIGQNWALGSGLRPPSETLSSLLSRGLCGGSMSTGTAALDGGGALLPRAAVHMCSHPRSLWSVGSLEQGVEMSGTLSRSDVLVACC